MNGIGLSTKGFGLLFFLVVAWALPTAWCDEGENGEDCECTCASDPSFIQRDRRPPLMLLVKRGLLPDKSDKENRLNDSFTARYLDLRAKDGKAVSLFQVQSDDSFRIDEPGISAKR